MSTTTELVKEGGYRYTIEPTKTGFTITLIAKPKKGELAHYLRFMSSFLWEEAKVADMIKSEKNE